MAYVVFYVHCVNSWKCMLIVIPFLFDKLLLLVCVYIKLKINFLVCFFWIHHSKRPGKRGQERISKISCLQSLRCLIIMYSFHFLYKLLYDFLWIWFSFFQSCNSNRIFLNKKLLQFFETKSVSIFCC